jgi:hypothetical protein
VNVVPVAKKREDKQEKCDQQQPGGFRRVGSMAMVFVSVIVLRIGHAAIVALRKLGSMKTHRGDDAAALCW